jgi:hypothetical protein
MKNRDINLKELRPPLNLSPASGEMEQFQNDVLRPILKFQNDLLLKVCHHQFVKRKNIFFQLPPIKQLEYVELQISQDQNFKNLLFGIIIGHFTSKDWIYFKDHEQDLRKRVTSLLIKRLQSQCSLLTSDFN